jgi:hypothetical protein
MQPLLGQQIRMARPADSVYVSLRPVRWQTTSNNNDTLIAAYDTMLDYTFGNGLSLIRIDGAMSANGVTNFVYSDSWVTINLPSDSSGPAISIGQSPATARSDLGFVVTATITDTNTGNHGVISARLEGGYGAFNQVLAAGAGPGGNGDGLWTFQVPAQTTRGGSPFQFRLVGLDGTGRSSTAGNWTVAIIDSNLDSDHDELPDWWELQYFGNLSATRLGDNDNDGVPNTLEFMLGAAPTNALTSPLVAWWPFDAGTAADATGHGNTGTITGATNTTNSVIGAKALLLAKQGDFVSFGFSQGLKGTNFTLHGFVNLTQKPSTGEALLWNNLAASAGCRLFVGTNGNLSFRTRGPGGEAVIKSPQSLRTNRWYHFAVTCDGQTAELYLDGVIVQSGNVLGKVAGAAPTDRTTVGNLATPTATNQLLAAVDELRYWNRKLTSNQLAVASSLLVEQFDQVPRWHTGYWDGTYAFNDATNFVWDATAKNLTIWQPNLAAGATLPYGYEFLDSAWTNGFTFRFDATVLWPGYEAPLRIGLKQNPSQNWGSDQGISCAFTFRATGFKLELYARSASAQQFQADWPDGFRLDDPPTWVRGQFTYDARSRQLNFALHDLSTSLLLATNSFTNVTGFGALTDVVVSQRGDSYGSSGYADLTVARIDNLAFLPYVAFAAPLAPPPNLTVNASMNGGFAIRFPAVPGSNYALEVSDALTNSWTTLGTLTSTNTSAEFFDPAAPTRSSRFYRVRVDP